MTWEPEGKERKGDVVGRIFFLQVSFILIAKKTPCILRPGVERGRGGGLVAQGRGVAERKKGTSPLKKRHVRIKRKASGMRKNGGSRFAPRTTEGGVGSVFKQCNGRQKEQVRRREVKPVWQSLAQRFPWAERDQGKVKKGGGQKRKNNRPGGKMEAVGGTSLQKYSFPGGTEFPMRLATGGAIRHSLEGILSRRWPSDQKHHIESKNWPGKNAPIH